MIFRPLQISWRYAIPYLLSVLLLIFAMYPAHAQKADSFALALADYSVKNLQEKVYVVTDRPYYALGDTIWFQTYLVNAINHQPITLSNTLYVDLLDSEGTVLQTRILLSQKGRAPGDFHLNEEWEQGVYQIRAYTRWMQNLPDDFVFLKRIEVTDIWPQGPEDTNQNNKGFDLKKEEVPKSGREITLQLFPEGGDLLAGFPGMVGFKASLVGTNKGVAVKGRVIEKESGNVTATFSSNPYGFGTFLLIKPDLEYIISLDSPDISFDYEFPKPKNDAYGLKVMNKLGANSVQLLLETNSKEGLAGAFLIGHCRGDVFAAVSLDNVDRYLARKMISVESALIPEGIVHFTLFDSAGLPRTERLLFMHHGNRKIAPVITPTVEKINPRDLVEVDLSLRDSLNASVSISITNKELVHRNALEENLYSYLYLSSDLSGQLEYPNYYFDDLDEDKYLELDHVMLIYGWRRFNWDDVINDSQMKVQPESGITVSGELKNFMFRKKPEAGIVQLIGMSKGAESFSQGFTFKVQETGDDGKFRFENLHYWDSVKFVVQSKKSQKAVSNSFYIQIDSIESPKTGPVDYYDFLKGERREAFIESSNKEYIIDKSYGTDVIVLDEIVVVDDKDDPVMEAIGGRYMTPDYRVFADSLPFQNGFLIDILRQIPFIQFDPEGNIQVRGVTPTVFLDGFELDQGMVSDVINGTSGNDVYFIDTDRSGFSNFRGVPVVYIYTKSGNGINLSGKNMEVPGILRMEHPGYYEAREFYAPEYDPNNDPVVKPDYRIQLYWNPEVPVMNGKARISFYVGDSRSDYEIVVEGIGQTGEVVLGRTFFSVK